MEKFTASNGLRIECSGDIIRVFNDNLDAVNVLADYDHLDASDTAALREFFQHERDQELGRWRWPENPQYVVYPTTDPDEFRVVNDATGISVLVRRSNLSKREGRVHFEGAAQAYFAAHPEPKPWHGAKHLEIWALTVQGCPSEAYIYREGFARRESAFRPVNHEERVQFARDDSRITGAHRIWPAVRDVPA